MTLYQADVMNCQVKKATRQGDKARHCFMWWSRRIDKASGNVLVVSALIPLQRFVAIISCAVVLRRSISDYLQVLRLKSPRHPAHRSNRAAILHLSVCNQWPSISLGFPQGYRLWQQDTLLKNFGANHYRFYGSKLRCQGPSQA